MFVCTHMFACTHSVKISVLMLKISVFMLKINVEDRTGVCVKGDLDLLSHI